MDDDFEEVTDEDEDDFEDTSEVISIFGPDVSMSIGFSRWVTILARFPASSSFRIFLDLSSTSFCKFRMTERHSELRSSRSEIFDSSDAILAASVADVVVRGIDTIGVDVAPGREGRSSDEEEPYPGKPKKII